MAVERYAELNEFRARYAEDDNEWWRTESGLHMNLFDDAIDIIEGVEEVVAEMGEHVDKSTDAWLYLVKLRKALDGTRHNGN